MSIDEIRALARTIGCTRTPLQFNGHLSEATGIEVWIKREDFQDEIGSGVKRRATAASIAHCRAFGFQTIVIDGVPHSNCVRAFAHYCDRDELPLHVVYRGEPPYPTVGNYAAVLNSNATIYNTHIEDFSRSLSAVVDRARRTCGNPLVVPAGAAAPYALLGPIGLAIELSEQFEEMGWMPDHVVLPVGTGGTVLGLAIGKLVQRELWKIIGIRIDEYPNSRYQMMHCEAARYFGSDLYRDYDLKRDIPFMFYEETLGGGYGRYGDKDVEDSERLFEETGIYFGPTYMWKCLKAVRLLANDGTFVRNSKVVMIHTGGTGERMAVRQIH